MLLSFDRLQDRPGLEITDHIERRQCLIHTSRAVDPEEIPTDEFTFPVDRGVEITTEAITLPHRTPVFVRNSLGYQIQELTKGEDCELPTDQYHVEMADGPVKLYLRVESELSINVGEDEVNLDFGAQNIVSIGARSYHEKPAATITTTEDPVDMMAAVSVLGSALKSTSPERSYPTLRGHPPEIELGDRLDIPEVLEKPDTGVTIEIPPEIRHVFVVAPLAYYLGADVVSGPVPTLVTETGYEHLLDDPAHGFEAEVERVLKQIFFLDCVTRTEGFYPINLHERNNLEGNVDLDFESLYNASMSERIEAYLSVPFEVIETEIPEWKLTAHVKMAPKNIEILPFVVNDLAIIRSANAEQLGSNSNPVSVDDFSRAGEFVRSSASSDRASAESAQSPTLVRPGDSASLEQTWIGDGAPVGASKAMIEAFRNRLDREPKEGEIDITVICNDPAMNSERDIVDDIYGSRDDLPFQVNERRELTVEELYGVLQEETQFLHYIGHIDERGFECEDGFLDMATVDSTGVESFLLNACTSYQQGMEMIRAGSIAGVVTVQDVINSGAETIGSSLAKLLNQGFPFRAALTIAKDQSIVGGQYLVLGDGGIDIAQCENGVPALVELTIDNSNILTYHTYHPTDHGLGVVTIPYVGSNNEFHLAGGESGEYKLSDQELVDFLSQETQPVDYKGKLYWTDEMSLTDLVNN